ncbi:MAG: TetR/AcrR family transcriptional regulator [Actinomycetota bacterium]
MANAVDQRQALIEATYGCIAKWGPSRTSLEDIAKTAGISRATLYRYFPGGRTELFDAVVAWEYDRFFRRLLDAVRSAVTLEEVMERGLQYAHRSITEHDVLQLVLSTEPELLESTFTRIGATTRELVASFLLPYLEQHDLVPGVVPTEAADYLARMVLSYMGSSGRWNLDDPEQVRMLVRVELLGGIAA